MQLEFKVTLQADDELIFQSDGTNRRIVVTTFELWIPRLRLSPAGQKMVNENFFKQTKWVYLKETLIPTGARRDAGGQVQLSSGVKNAKHVFVFFQQTREKDLLAQNPYLFDTLDLDGDNSAKLATCCLQYGETYLPELEYERDDFIRIWRDLIEFRYRKNDYNTDTQLDVTNYALLYPVIYFDLRTTKESVTGDLKKLVLHYRLNEAANAHDYDIFAAVLNEEEIVIQQ